MAPSLGIIKFCLHKMHIHNTLHNLWILKVEQIFSLQKRRTLSSSTWPSNTPISLSLLVRCSGTPASEGHLVTLSVSLTGQWGRYSVSSKKLESKTTPLSSSHLTMGKRVDCHVVSGFDILYTYLLHVC